MVGMVTGSGNLIPIEVFFHLHFQLDDVYLDLSFLSFSAQNPLLLEEELLVCRR